MMESVGQKLRRARLDRGLTLDQISRETRISFFNLQAVENDQPARIPGAFFYRSFVKQFAKQVGVPYEDLEAEVCALSEELAHPLPVTTEDQVSFEPKVQALGGTHRRKHRAGYSVVSLIGVLIVCSGLHSVWKTAERSREQLRSQNPIHTPQSNGRQDPASGAHHSGSDPDYRIQLSALERTWLSMIADGRQIFRGVLEPSQTKTLEGRDSAQIRTGNAGAVRIVFSCSATGSTSRRIVALAVWVGSCS